MITRTNSSFMNQKNQQLSKSTTFSIAKKTSQLFLVFVLLFSVSTAFAGQPTKGIETNASFFDHFSDDDIVKVRIETNIADLIENRKRKSYLPATLKWEDNEGNWHQLDAGVKPRGKFRRRICDFPPLKLKLSKDDLQQAGFTSFNKLKLVTHCIDDKSAGNENVLKEYLAYKLYSELTPNSYRVQLVKITYVDNVGDYGTQTRYGFFIESKKEMAKRIGGVICDECYSPQADDIVLADENTMAVFQYMIGNADWNLATNKNITLVKKKGTTKLTPVPYDFDFAGLVSTSYAIPNPDFGLKNITDRVFLGIAANDVQLEETIALFLQKRSSFKQQVKASKALNFTAKQFVYSYINDFYKELEGLQEIPNNTTIYQTLKNAHIERANAAAGEPVGR